MMNFLGAAVIGLAQAANMPAVLGIVFVVVLLILGFIFMMFGKLWLQAFLSGAHISLATLVGMTLRKVNPRVIVDSKIMALKAGIAVGESDLEAHYLAGGNVYNVVQAIISADKADIPLDFKRAAAIDLAGRNVLEAVKTSVYPKVIQVPNVNNPRKTVDAIAKDGIQLQAKALVTVRTNLDRIVGGATEETIIARVGEGIVTTIGSSNTHKEVLENPDRISKTVLGKGLDSGTAFEIVSIDIADIDVGENIGAKLQADQAEADMRIAQAKAEERRALAVAMEQEFKAVVVENRAKVIEAEAQVPLAMAQAFREGNLGIMDYVRLKNIQADTGMRESLGGEKGKDSKS